MAQGAGRNELAASGSWPHKVMSNCNSLPGCKAHDQAVCSPPGSRLREWVEILQVHDAPAPGEDVVIDLSPSGGPTHPTMLGLPASPADSDQSCGLRVPRSRVRGEVWFLAISVRLVFFRLVQIHDLDAPSGTYDLAQVVFAFSSADRDDDSLRHVDTVAIRRRMADRTSASRARPPSMYTSAASRSPGGFCWIWSPGARETVTSLSTVP
jgi:hypothetical protein